MHELKQTREELTEDEVLGKEAFYLFFYYSQWGEAESTWY
jgi:hypothetical protein